MCGRQLRLDSSDRPDTAGFDGAHQPFMISLGLISVALCPRGKSFVKCRVPSAITRNGSCITASSMTSSQKSGARPGVEAKRFSGEIRGLNRCFHVLHLPHEIGPSIYDCVAQHDVAGSLQGGLTHHFAFAM